MLCRASLFWLGLGLTGCLMPPSPAERLTDAARELNLAARFGRMDLAVSRTTRAARQPFVARHAGWGKGLRVVDVELVGMSLDEGGKRALVEVDVAWVRNEDSALRATRLQQVWHNEDGGWRLARERRSGGDLGLFGEPVDVLHPPPRDVHFATKTLGREDSPPDAP
jgi:hypothetical protein